MCGGVTRHCGPSARRHTGQGKSPHHFPFCGRTKPPEGQPRIAGASSRPYWSIDRVPTYHAALQQLSTTADRRAARGLAT